MEFAELVQLVESALGFTNDKVLAQGGQKLVLQGTLAGMAAVAKIVLLEGSPNRAIAIERAHREVELLEAVDSPHVVRVLTDAIEIGDPSFAVCWAEELLGGEDVTAHLDHLWDPVDLWTLLRDGAAALAACHDLDVVHRDLSPGNIRRDEDGRYVLMDPGLARHLEKTAITGAFQPGTPGWRSPEHVAGGDPMPASDVFCLGLQAYYAATGAHAILPDPDPAVYDNRLRTTQAPSVLQLRGDIPIELAAIIDRCLERQPARRYIDGVELGDAVLAATGESS